MRLFDLMATNFENFDNTVRGYLQKSLRSLGIEYSSTNIFGLILNVIKGVMQNAMFYIEDAFTEQNIETARRKKSIYNLAKLSGYVPFYGAAATGTVYISALAGGVTSLTGGDDKVSTKLYIRDGSLIRNTATGIVYTVMLPVDEYVIDIAKPLIKHEFKVVEGNWSYSTFSATGKAFETFSVGVNGLFDKNYIKVYVNNELWNEADSIYDLSQYEKGYVVTPGFDSLFSITFGNDLYGYKLENGDTVTVKFIMHNGSGGNTSSESFAFESSTFNSNGTSVNPNQYLTITSSNKITGGTDADSIDTVREAVGKDSQTNTYVTTEHYELFLSRFSFVGWSSVFSDASSMQITACCLHDINVSDDNKLDYFNQTGSGLYLTDHEKTIIEDTLDHSNKSFAGINFKIIDPIIRQYAAITYVKLKDNTNNRELIKENIREAFADYFTGIKKSTRYITKSALINKILTDYPDIFEAVDIDFISDKAEGAFYTGYYSDYEYKVTNGHGSYIKINKPYEKNSTPGLDTFGNIELTSDLEFILLTSGFKYFPDKNDKNNSITIQEPVSVYFY